MDPELREYTLLGRNGRPETHRLVLLGHGTSYAEGKKRWFEVTIYADENDAYLVHTVGRTTIEGERDLARIERTVSPYDVIELLTVRRASRNHSGDRAVAPYVPRPSARAIAQAAEFDDGLHEAYLRQVA